MKFGKSILLPSYSRKSDFNSLNSTEKSFKFGCVNCQSKIQIKYDSIIENKWNWEDKFDDKTNSEIKQFYDINAVNKSPADGWTAIGKFQCGNCQTEYLIYAGVDEYYNSLYKVTLQGITEIIES
jgi:hypothetical protein